MKKLSSFGFICLTVQLIPVLTFPTKNSNAQAKQNGEEFSPENETYVASETLLPNITDALISSTTYRLQSLFAFPTTAKPQNDKERHEDSSSAEPLTPAAQNYFTTYYQPHHISPPPLGHSRPTYHHPTEEPFLAKYLAQPRPKQFIQRSRLHQAYSNFDPTLMGSGDFGILRGGTFYANEDSSSYHHEEEDSNTDFYYSEASETQGEDAVTEGFIQKYTYPEEQFADFRDFAELNAPGDAAFSNYVVVYAAALNSTQKEKAPAADIKKIPHNIFDRLQQIDEENAAEAGKLKKNTKGRLSSTKLKLIKTKIIKKKLLNKTNKNLNEEDPLLALS